MSKCYSKLAWSKILIITNWKNVLETISSELATLLQCQMFDFINTWQVLSLKNKWFFYVEV